MRTAFSMKICYSSSKPAELSVSSFLKLIFRLVFASMLFARTISIISIPVASYTVCIVCAMRTDTLPDTPDTPDASPPIIETLSIAPKG